VAKKLIFSAEEGAFLKELVKNEVRFMIVGLSAAALQGAPVVTQDIDLWFRDLSDPGIKKALKKVGGAFVPPDWTQSAHVRRKEYSVIRHRDYFARSGIF
jgi:hypothetical protein